MKTSEKIITTLLCLVISIGSRASESQAPPERVQKQRAAERMLSMKRTGIIMGAGKDETAQKSIGLVGLSADSLKCIEKEAATLSEHLKTIEIKIEIRSSDLLSLEKRLSNSERKDKSLEREYSEKRSEYVALILSKKEKESRLKSLQSILNGKEESPTNNE